MELELKEQLINLIINDKPIPDYYEKILFPQCKKEYDLTYYNKLTKEEVLTNKDGVDPVPLQVKIQSGADGEKWTNMIINGDNLQLLKLIYENEDPIIKDKVKGKVNLIYIDPPFATEADFKNSQGITAYRDKIVGSEFIEYLRRRLIVAKEILSDNGSIFIHLDERMSHYIRVVMDEVFGKNNFVSEIIWSFSRIGGNAQKFEKNHENIYWYSKKGEYIFNKDDVRQPYEEKFLKTCKKDENGNLFYTRGLGKDGDKLNRKKVSYINPKGKSPSNVWNDIQYNPTAKSEKTGYPTQKPEELLKRIILATTNEGDLVMDFFAGSGTTAAVAEKLNRRWIVCDIGKYSTYTTQSRIASIRNSKSLTEKKKLYKKEAKDFIVCQIGSYDLDNTLNLEWKRYLKFVSNLFKIKLQSYSINGVEFDGSKETQPVVIWNFKKYRDIYVNSEYIDNLCSTISSKRCSVIYIVAPINYFEFFEDVLDRNGIRFYFLKIPYEIISELHLKNFSQNLQPQDKEKINLFDNNIGFNFKVPIKVGYEIKKSESENYIEIYEFISNHNTNTTSNLQDLSCVFIGNKDSKGIFILQETIFYKNFKKDLPNKIYSRIVSNTFSTLRFCDIYGNELEVEINAE